MQYGHKLVVFATKKFVIPLSLSPKVNTAEIFRNSMIQKFLFRQHRMVSLSDAFKSQVVIKQTAQGVPKQDIKKLDLIEITISRRCIVPTSLDVLVILSAIALQNVITAQVLSKQPSIYLRIAQSKEDTSQVLAIFATCQNVCGGGTVFNLQ